MALPLPLETSPSESPRDFILIYSGASSTGVFAIQLAKLSGLRDHNVVSVEIREGKDTWCGGCI